MSQIGIDGSIGSLLSFYKHERNIFGRCPHCREPFRLSEVKLTFGKEPPRDLLSNLKRDRDKLKEKLENMEAEIEDAEDTHSYEIEALNTKWKDKVDVEIDRRLEKRVKEIRRNAIAKSRAGQLGKTLEKIAPMFPGFGHHPYDVRPVFDPIDFVVFDGYYQGAVTDIVFVEFKTGQSRLNSVQGSIREAIGKRRIHFEERRLGKETIKMLTEGRQPKTGKTIKRIVE